MPYVFCEDNSPLSQREVNVRHVLQQTAVTLQNADRALQVCHEDIEKALRDINATLNALNPTHAPNSSSAYLPQFARGNPAWRTSPYDGHFGMSLGKGRGRSRGSANDVYAAHARGA